MSKWSPPGLPDEAFIRGKAPMTKSEVRTITMAKLQLRPTSRVLDIGAGTGSLTIEAALLCPEGQVVAIERKQTALDLLSQNIEHFNLNNVTVIDGLAPQDLPKDQVFDAIVIGGTGGQMAEVIDYVKAHLVPGGRVCVNLITPENVAKALEGLRGGGFTEPEIISLQVSRGRRVGDVTLMEAQNPITIITASRL